MNKQGAGSFSFLVNSALVIAFIGLIIFLLVGAGGGFQALTNIGGVMAQIPAWVYIVVAMIWLVSSMFGGNKR